MTRTVTLAALFLVGCSAPIHLAHMDGIRIRVVDEREAGRACGAPQPVKGCCIDGTAYVTSPETLRHEVRHHEATRKGVPLASQHEVIGDE